MEALGPQRVPLGMRVQTVGEHVRLVRTEQRESAEQVEVRVDTTLALATAPAVLSRQESQG